MFRFARSVVGRTNALFSQAAIQSNIVRNVPGRSFTALSAMPSRSLCLPDALKHLRLTPTTVNAVVTPTQLECVPVRTVTKYSLRTGKRKTMHSTVERFFRLHWGGWIRTRCGRNKKMFKKKGNLKHRLRQHVLVNAKQSTLLDKMVTKFWKRPKHYVDDIYEPYHQRTFYDACWKPMPKPDQPLKQWTSVRDIAKGNY